MKKPWEIGLLSIIPVPDFIVLGKILQGFIVLIVVAFFASLGFCSLGECFLRARQLVWILSGIGLGVDRFLSKNPYDKEARSKY